MLTVSVSFKDFPNETCYLTASSYVAYIRDHALAYAHAYSHAHTLSSKSHPTVLKELL